MDKGRRDVNCMTVGSYGSFGCTQNGAVYLDRGKRRRYSVYHNIMALSPHNYLLNKGFFIFGTGNNNITSPKAFSS